MSRLTWSQGSVDDLVRIKAFLDQHDPQAALRTVYAIRSAADFLSRYPGAGPVMDAQLRRFRVRGTPYLLLYRPFESRLEIARVRHVREDWRTE